MTISTKLCRMCEYIGHKCVKPKSCTIKSLSSSQYTFINQYPNININTYSPQKKLPSRCTGDIAICTFMHCMCDILNKREIDKLLEKI
jgi:hypothetical protein